MEIHVDNFAIVVIEIPRDRRALVTRVGAEATMLANVPEAVTLTLTLVAALSRRAARFELSQITSARTGHVQCSWAHNA